MADKSASSKERLAREAWRQIFSFIVATAQARDQILERLQITVAESRALSSLDPTRGWPIGKLAEEWSCDPSTATWLVDRLEKRGLAERRSIPNDRRVKEVVLTEDGSRLKGKLVEALYQPPPELLALPTADLKVLSSALTLLPDLRPGSEFDG